MKQGTSFMKRSLALLLVAIMVVSNLSGLTLPARAVGGNSVTVPVGEIVAGNYDLTAEEKALLESGLLVGGSITYTAPTDSDLIQIDTDEKTITVESYTDAQGNKWVATNAAIYVGETKKEDVALTDGVGNYAYGENAFSVKVTYVLYVEIDEALQETLLGAPAMLQNGLANMKAAYDGTDANLGTIVMAMDILGQLADGISMDMGGWTMSAKFGDDAINAVEALEAQMAANDGKLDMELLNAAYAAAAFKVQFLDEQGAEYKDAVATLYQSLNAIAVDPLMNNQILDQYLEGMDPTGFTAWKALKGILNNTVAALEPAVNGDWSALENELLAEGLTAAEFATLDGMVAALGTHTVINKINNPLLVAETTVTLNMSMFNVTVNVVLNTVKANQVTEYGKKTVVLTLAENATAAEIQAAVEASGIVDDALTSWNGAYVAEHFEVAMTTLPGTLTSDIEYTITYSPKYYTVSFDYAESQTLPYGYELVLPRHENPAKAYDYTVNGVLYSQGATYTVVGNTTISREEGKAYTTHDLYTVIADNYGDPILADILKSGALNENVIINVRKPDPADAESLVTLVNGYLTAKPVYESDYAGLSWVPYSYGENGTEYLFDGEFTVAWNSSSVKVQYILVLSNFSAASVQSIVERVAQLKAEADDQLSVLNTLANNYDAMGQLDKTKLGALNGVIGVTDFTPGDGTDTDAENLRLRAYFSNVVGQIIASNVDSNNYLKIYNMLGEYKDPNTGGLTYYYNNSEAIIAEINSLSGYLTELVEEEEALKIMVTAAGFPEYADKIMNLEESMATVKESLTPPNALINLDSPNLYELIDALNAIGSVDTEKGTQSPFLLSDMLAALDDSTAMLQVVVSIGESTKNFTTRALNRGEALTADDINALIADVEAYAAEQLGNKISFYEITGLEELAAMIGQTLSAGTSTMYVSYNVEEYDIVIDGMDEEFTVSIENATITLPAHQTPGYVYTYIVFDREIVVGQTPVTIVLTADEMASIVNGVYTITWTEFNKAEADMVGKLDALVNKLKGALGDKNVTLDGKVLTVNMDASQLMDFVMTLAMNGGYGYYGLNNQGLVYMSDQNVLQLSVQTLINAVLSDEEFNRDSLIALGKNNGGKLFSASLQLGDSATVLDYEDMTLVVNLSSVPSQMKTALNALERVKSYLNFYSEDGVLQVELNLPDQVYGAYLTALIATGHVDKSNTNAINQEIAFQFFCDYLGALINSENDMETFENTLKLLGRELTLDEYEAYYKMLAQSLQYEVLEEDGGMNIGLTLAGKTTIDGLLNLLGMGSSFSSYLGMIAEYQDGASINLPAHTILNNVDRDYCALILDVNASGVTNKIACIRTEDWAKLNDKTSHIAGYAVIILLGDVQGDLNIAGTTILDLNGHDVTGTIKSTGNLFIIDSSMDTYNAGVVNDVAGKVTIIGGNYLSEVPASYLKDGYYMDGTTVRNAMYFIEADDAGNVTFVINSDVYKSDEIDGYVPNLTAMALDIATDLLLNYATTAGLTINGNTIYDVSFEDLIGLLESRSGEDVIDMLLASVSAASISGFANDVIADLIDFENIYEALYNNTNVAEYELTVAPWMVAIERTPEDYLTLSILSNAAEAESFKLALRVEGDSIDYVMDLAYELAQIVEKDKTSITIDIEQPTYNNKEFYISAAGSAVVSINMSENSNYAKFIAIILAYGNSNMAAAVVEAINNDDMTALKDVVDNTTVAQLFTALKAMNRGTDLLAMARAIGLDTANLGEVAELEQVFHLLLVAAGKSLEELEITGMSSKLGNLYNEATGYYELNKGNMFRDGELTVRGYGASYELGITELSFNLKLFGEIDPPAHQHNYEAVVTEPTCTEQGYTTYTCSVCGDTYVADYVDALGHDMGQWGIVTEATCTENGEENRSCQRCDYIETRVIEAYGHNHESVVTEPTCTEQGYTTYTCANCGDTYVADYVDALGHAWGDWVVVKEPECHGTGVKGEKQRTCSACGEVEIEEIPTTDHVYVDGVCKWCGYEEGTNPPMGMAAIGGIVFLTITATMGFVVLIVRRKKLLN